MTVTIEQWQAGRSVEGAPPWDGTGVPFPVDETGWPEVPGGGSDTIYVSPGQEFGFPHDDPRVVAEPLTAWAASAQPAHFTDGDFKWDGDSWEVYVPTTITIAAPPPTPAGSSFGITVETSDDPGFPVYFQYQVAGYAWSAPTPLTVVDATHYTGTVDTTASQYAEGVTVHIEASFPGPADREPDTEPLAVSGLDVVLTAPVVADPDMGWTVAELREFAADHEPPIDIPSSATTKAQILQVILAYLASHPEEN